MPKSLRTFLHVVLIPLALMLAAAVSPGEAQETTSPKPAGFKFRFSFEGEVDWTPKPADSEKPAGSPGILGGQVKGTFSGTWSLEPARAPTPTEGTPSQPATRNGDHKLSADEQAIVDQTNAERKKANLPPLTVHPALMTMAREQSRLMADAKTLSHQINGRSFETRLRDSKYLSRAAGENCAEGAETSQEAIKGWMQSPGHKANILSTDYREIGVGLARSSEGRPYYTQVFASPAEPE